MSNAIQEIKDYEDLAQIYNLRDFDKTYNRYLSWDRDNVSYAFTMSYEEDLLGQPNSITRNYMTKKTKGADSFKRLFFECLSSNDPKKIIITEWNGESRTSKQSSSIPIVIKIIKLGIGSLNGVAKQDDSEKQQAPTNNGELSLANVIGGMMGLGDEANPASKQTIFLMEFMEKIRAKDDAIAKLQNEITRLGYEMRRVEADSENKISNLQQEQYDLREVIAENEKEIEALEEEREELEERLEALTQNNESLSVEKKAIESKSTLYAVGADAVTKLFGKVAIGYVKGNPNVLGGIDENTINAIEQMILGESSTPAQVQEPIRRREVEEVVEGVEELSQDELLKRTYIKETNQWLTDNWTAEELPKLVQIIQYCTNNPARQDAVLNAINKSLKMESAKQSTIQPQSNNEE